MNKSNKKESANEKLDVIKDIVAIIFLLFKNHFRSGSIFAEALLKAF